MATLKRGLGRGLSALIPQKEFELSEFSPSGEIEINKVVPNPRQPRQNFNDEQLQELANSISVQGVAQPILVRPRGEGYELIAGERRWRAAKIAGLQTVPALIKDLSDEQSLEIALVENLQREDLNPIDEARAYKQLSLEFNLTQESIAQRVGKDRSTVANTLRLLELPSEIQNLVLENKITAGHARALLSLSDPRLQMEICKLTIKKGLNVRAVERLVTVKSKKSKESPNPLPLELQDIQDRLTSHLGTKVTIKGSDKKGKIEVEYFSREDLERIAEIILKTI